MKQLTFMVIFILFPYIAMAQENKKSTYSDHVPSWVKEKVTLEEYKKLETIHTKFYIDYSFLQQELTTNQKDKFTQLIQRIYTDILNGKYADKERTNLLFVPFDTYTDP